MAGICTASTRLNGAGCDHRTVTVSLDGESFEFATGEHLLDAMAWTADEKRQFILLGLKRLRTLGLTLDAAVNRVTNGDEATTVKMYDFFGPGAAITKSNIGTSYVNICTGASGERIVADFTGCTEFRVMLNANLVGTGQWGARIVRDSDSEVLIDAPNLGAAGERELDPGWTALPAAFLGQGLTYLRVQGKSQTAADDPVWRRCTLGLR
jgi:hypothetical protein